MKTPDESEGDPSNGRGASFGKAVDKGAGRHDAFNVAAVLCIAVVGLAAYVNSFHGPFVFDDEHQIVENPEIHWQQLGWRELVSALRPDHGHATSRPVAQISFALNCYCGGDNVVGYHVVNVVIHLLNAVLVYLLALTTLRRIRRREISSLRPSTSHWIVLAAALIFVSHPIQTQAVTYVVQRMTSMCVLFYLAALLLYVYGRSGESIRRRWTLWIGCFLCWVLALGSKQIAATLPLTILLYEWYFFQDLSGRWLRNNARFVLLAALLLGMLAWAYLGHQPLERLLAGYAKRDFSIYERVLTQFRVVMFYMSLLVFPHPSRLNLTHDVVTSQSLLAPITTLTSMMVVFGLLGLAVYLARQYRLISFCLLWFFLNLVIESSVIPLEMIFEHRLYLPMFGFSLLVAWLLFAVAGAKSWCAIGAAATICLLLAVGTYQRNQVWKDELVLWSDAVSKSPQHARAHNNLGVVLGKRERYNEAVAHFQEALRLKPGYGKARNNLLRAQVQLRQKRSRKTVPFNVRPF